MNQYFIVIAIRWPPLPISTLFDEGQSFSKFGTVGENLLTSENKNIASKLKTRKRNLHIASIFFFLEVTSRRLKLQEWDGDGEFHEVFRVRERGKG